LYLDFYNLESKPFDLSPSPRFLYLGEGHKEALALLTYGVRDRKGFILLTGEVGTGKTTMIHTLLVNLDNQVLPIHISNPTLTQSEFFDYVASHTFKKQLQFKSKTNFLVAFEIYLKKLAQQQHLFLLIVDEAHQLSFELLEEIRLLSNLETTEQKLINILLVGQPELNEKLRDPRCRPLLQRIGMRYHIKPLDLHETRAYILTRLEKAGWKGGQTIFPKKTINAIYKFSEGYPRMINVIADNALLLGYSKGSKKISGDMIKVCFRDLSLPLQPSKYAVTKNGSRKKYEKEEPQSESMLRGRTPFLSKLRAKFGLRSKPSHIIEPFYWGSMKSFRFHRPGCPTIPNIQSNNLTKLKNRGNALREGFKPCKLCRP
jgi:general secretion pathway protein A